RQRDHRKVVVVDGVKAFIGGRNAADEYYYDWSEVPIADWTLADSIPWLDAHVQVEGPLVRDIQTLFNHTWQRNGGQPGSLVARTASGKTGSKAGKKGNRAMLVVH